MSKLAQARLVNAITFARVPLIFAWLFFALVYEYRGGIVYFVFAALSMLLSGLTDLWDGRLARKWAVVSTLGKMADPLMDKVFYIVAFPALTWLAMHQGESDCHTLALLSLTILYMLRDTWVTFMRMIGTMYGADVAAAYLGKVRTALSFPGAGWIYLTLTCGPLLPAAWAEPLRYSCYFVEGVLVLLTLWSLVTYTKDYSPYLFRALEQK